MKLYSDVVLEEEEEEDGHDDDQRNYQNQQQQQMIHPIAGQLNDEIFPLFSSSKTSVDSYISKNIPPIRPTVHDFYFPSINPTVQTYYRFKTSQVTPFAALHTRPLDGPFGRMMNSYSSSSSSSFNYGSINGGNFNSNNGGGGVSKSSPGGGNVSNVTGLLRRSAVLPCHGMFTFIICMLLSFCMAKKSSLFTHVILC